MTWKATWEHDVEADMDYDYNDSFDPEVEDAHNNHGQELTMEDVLGKPKENRTMHNNIKVISRPNVGMSAHSLNTGEYARVSSPSGDFSVGDIVLKTRNGVVNISNPKVVWDSPFASPFVERLNTGDKLEITVGLTPEFEERIRSEARGNKILAIKAVREATNWGLKEAKDYVEGLMLKF